MHSTDDMKTYLTWTAKNGQTKRKRYVDYLGNWVQLNTLDSLILFPTPPPKKKKTMKFSETVKLLSELFGPNITFS